MSTIDFYPGDSKCRQGTLNPTSNFDILDYGHTIPYMTPLLLRDQKVENYFMIILVAFKYNLNRTSTWSYVEL